MRRLKDAAIAKILQGVVNMKLENIGRVTQLSIDSKKKHIFLEVLLKGEEEPLSVEIVAYRIEGDQLFIDEVKASREWLEAVFETFIKQKPLQIPPEVAKYLALIL